MVRLFEIGESKSEKESNDVQITHTNFVHIFTISEKALPIISNHFRELKE